LQSIEEGTAKMMDGSACKIIGIGTINIKGEMGWCILCGRFGMSRRYGTI